MDSKSKKYVITQAVMSGNQQRQLPAEFEPQKLWNMWYKIHIVKCFSNLNRIKILARQNNYQNFSFKKTKLLKRNFAGRLIHILDTAEIRIAKLKLTSEESTDNAVWRDKVRQNMREVMRFRVKVGHITDEEDWLFSFVSRLLLYWFTL